MSEQNILNPLGAGDPLNPSYGYNEGRLPGHAIEQAASGRLYARTRLGRGRVFELGWNDLSKANKEKLRQWAEQYALTYFSFYDGERGRYFTGRFDPQFSDKGPLLISPVQNDRWDVRARFIEEPTRPLYAYPSDWTNWAVFLEERDDAGADLLVIGAGTWNYETHANHHGGAAYSNANTNTADYVEWTCFGYGFRLWARKDTNLGILSLSARRLRDNTTVLAATNVDLYADGDTPSAAVYTKADLSLDWYIVKLLGTNTKNASATAKTIYADAIQVMR
jgi:hypothetical protein